MDGAHNRNEQGRFISGNIGGPGRPKGSRNKLGEEFCTALHDDFQKHGVAVIETVRIKRPADYLKLVASLVSRQIDLAATVYEYPEKGAVTELLNELIAEATRESSARGPSRAGP